MKRNDVLRHAQDCLLRLQQHPRRWLIVTIGTFVTGLVTILPLVDEYKDLTDRRGELERDLSAARADAASLLRFEKRVEAQKVVLARLDATTVSEANLNEFRGEVVSLVRECGCQVRKIQAGSMQTRPWLKKDNPLESTRKAKKTEETPYLLTSQPFSLSVTGTVPQLTQLLSRLHATQRLAHTRDWIMSPADRAGTQVEMGLELTLFDLIPKPASGKKPAPPNPTKTI